MSGKASQLKSLDAAKELLIAESELNRQQLVHECELLRHSMGGVMRHTRSVGSVAFSSAAFLAGLMAHRHHGGGAAKPRSGVMEAVRIGGQVLSWVLPMLQSRAKKGK